jgi:hypothetical protein
MRSAKLARFRVSSDPINEQRERFWVVKAETPTNNEAAKTFRTRMMHLPLADTDPELEPMPAG